MFDDGPIYGTLIVLEALVTAAVTMTVVPDVATVTLTMMVAFAMMVPRRRAPKPVRTTQSHQ